MNAEKARQAFYAAATSDVAVIYVVYDSPKDMSGQWVIRRHEITRAGVKATPWFAAADSLEHARAAIPKGFAKVPRHPSDEPHIVETWMDVGLAAMAAVYLTGGGTA